MAGRLWLLLAIMSELGVFIVYANDPDHFDVAQLVDFPHLHHEFFEVLLAVAAAAFYLAYLVRDKRARAPQGGPKYAA